MQLGIAALGTHIAQQRTVLEAAKDHLNTLDPNAEGLKARIEELIAAQPVEAIDEILRLTGLVHRLTEKVKFMNGIIARHGLADVPETQHPHAKEPPCPPSS